MGDITLAVQGLSDLVVAVLAKDFTGPEDAVTSHPRQSAQYGNTTTGYAANAPLEWKVTVPRAGQWYLHALMASGEPRPCDLTINGQNQDGKILDGVTGGYDANKLQWFVHGPYDLKAGENVFCIRSGPLWLPCLKMFLFTTEPNVIRVLAKDHLQPAGGGISSAEPVHGMLYSWGQASWVAWKVNLPAEGKWYLHALAAAGEDRHYQLKIDDQVQSGQLTIRASGSNGNESLRWHSFGPYHFKQGESTFRLDFSNWSACIREFILARDPADAPAQAKPAPATTAEPTVDPLKHFYLEVEVNGEWKGVHVHNQSAGDGAQLVRHSGRGNRMRVVNSPHVAGAYQILVEVDGAWKGLHVQHQSSEDNVNIIRCTGDGNTFKIVKNPQGTYYLLVQAHENFAEWKGVHVYHQKGEDNTALVRHRGDGNAFRIIPAEPVIAGPTQTTDLTAKIAELAGTVADLQGKLAKCADCEAKLAEQANVIRELRDKNAQQAATIEHLSTQVAARPDDLEIIEGIGPKIADVLKKEGITTFKQLAATEASRIKAILTTAGVRAPSDPSSWPKQAQLAADGKMDELKALQAKLQAGRG